MYKILLADEEGVALEALRVMIDSDYGENCDIRLAVNSAQLNDIFPKFLPDIAFINIQMAGMHGISSIRELHTRQMQCLFVIVSYNKKVDYGREGSNMGIHGYMIKPLRRDPVKKLLKEYFSILDTEAKRSTMEKELKQEWDQVIPMMESGMVSELIFPDPLDNNLPVYQAMLNIKHNYAWVMHLKYGQINEHGTMCNPIGSVVQLSHQNIYFRKIIKAFFPTAIIGPLLGNHFLVLVPCSLAKFNDTEKEIRQKRIEDMTYQLHRKLNLYFRYQIQEPKPISDLSPLSMQ